MKQIARILPLILLALFLIAGLASATFIPKLNCYASSKLSASFPGSNACNNNDGDNWIAAGTTNEWVIVNLTTTWTLVNVSIKFGNYPFNGHIDVWNGASWIAYKNFTQPTANTNQTYQLDHTFKADRFRVFETTTSLGNVGVLEVWPQGNAIPVIPPCALGEIGKTTDTLIPILVSAGLIVFSLGFFYIALDSRGNPKKGISIELLIVGVIGLVVAIAVTAGVVASMKVC